MKSHAQNKYSENISYARFFSADIAQKLNK